MTTAAPLQPRVSIVRGPHATRGSRLLRTTDPKDIRIVHLVTSF